MIEHMPEPEQAIVDPHHHLWDLSPMLAHMPETAHPFGAILRQNPCYLFDELLAVCRGAGHDASFASSAARFYGVEGILA